METQCFLLAVITIFNNFIPSVLHFVHHNTSQVRLFVRGKVSCRSDDPLFVFRAFLLLQISYYYCSNSLPWKNTVLKSVAAYQRQERYTYGQTDWWEWLTSYDSGIGSSAVMDIYTLLHAEWLRHSKVGSGGYTYAKYSDRISPCSLASLIYFPKNVVLCDFHAVYMFVYPVLQFLNAWTRLNEPLRLSHCSCAHLTGVPVHHKARK
jgi:hypothetical protein